MAMIMLKIRIDKSQILSVLNSFSSNIGGSRRSFVVRPFVYPRNSLY